MKKLALFILSMLLVLPLAFGANTIKTKGVNQGDLVNALKSTQTLVNELAADHDADNATVAELVADHDADNDVIDALRTKAGLQKHGTLVTGFDLANGSTAGKAKTLLTTIYTVNGIGAQKAATDDLCDATGLVDLTNNYTKLLFTINVAGTCTVTDATHGASQGAVAWPAIPAASIVLGGLEIGDGTSHDWNVATLTDDGGTYVMASGITDAMATSVAANLSATSVAADLAADSTLGSGTESDPEVVVTE